MSFKRAILELRLLKLVSRYKTLAQQREAVDEAAGNTLSSAMGSRLLALKARWEGKARRWGRGGGGGGAGKEGSRCQG